VKAMHMKIGRYRYQRFKLPIEIEPEKKIKRHEYFK
jgi:hypothetical protein